LQIDELGNWCLERLVGTLCKYEAQQGGFHGDPGRGNQPCQWLPSSTITLKEHQWKYLPNTQYLPGSGFQPEWKGQGSKFASAAMEKICGDGKVKAGGEQGCLVSS